VSWLLEAHGRVTAGQWLGVALLAFGVVTGQLGVPQLLQAAWLENLSIGVAAAVSLVRAPGRHVLLPGWMARRARNGLVVGLSSASAPPTGPQPPPPPPGARPLDARPRIESGYALLVLLVPLAMLTLFHGTFISTLGSIASSGGDGSGAGGPVAGSVLVAAAVARAFRRIDPDQALSYAFGRVLLLHVASIAGVGAIVITSVGTALTGARSTLELAVTLAFVAAFALVDRSRIGVRTG
jgi:hypothetical protein